MVELPKRTNRHIHTTRHNIHIIAKLIKDTQFFFFFFFFFCYSIVNMLYLGIPF